MTKPYKTIIYSTMSQPIERRFITICIVDDEKDIRDMYKQMVETSPQKDLKVVGDFEDSIKAAEAIENNILPKGAPDVVVTDYNMPGMNGSQLAARIRNSRPDIQIIMVNGIKNNGDYLFINGLLKQKVIDAWFSKPCDIFELEETIRRLASQRR